MKKIIIELEDSIYTKLNEIKNDIQKRSKDTEVTIEQIAAEFVSEAVKFDDKLKGARDNMNDMFGDLAGLNPEDMLNNLKDLFGNMAGNMKPDADKKTKATSKTSKEDSEDDNEEEFEFKS